MQQGTFNNWTNYSEYPGDEVFTNGIQELLNTSYNFKVFEEFFTQNVPGHFWILRPTCCTVFYVFRQTKRIFLVLTYLREAICKQIKARSLVVSDLRSETKGSRF